MQEAKAGAAGDTCFSPGGTPIRTWHYLPCADGLGDAAVVQARWCKGGAWELARLRVSAARMGGREWEYRRPCVRPSRARVTDVVVAQARSGSTPREIAEMVGWRPKSVSSLLSRARAAGEVIPRSPPSRPNSGGSVASRGSHAESLLRMTSCQRQRWVV